MLPAECVVTTAFVITEFASRHPDKINASQGSTEMAEADEKMKEINTAYARLSKGDDSSDDDCDDIFNDFEEKFGGGFGGSGIPADVFMYLCVPSLSLALLPTGPVSRPCTDAAF